MNGKTEEEVSESITIGDPLLLVENKTRSPGSFPWKWRMLSLNKEITGDRSKGEDQHYQGITSEAYENIEYGPQKGIFIFKISIN